ncbi:STAS-like domain-containing protein [Limosilactobacillus reuteri]
MTNIILVKDIVNDSFSPIGGHQLGKKVVTMLKNSEKNIVLNFDKIAPFTTLFFNAMFKDISVDYNLQEITKEIKIESLGKVDQDTYYRSLNNATTKQKEQSNANK